MKRALIFLCVVTVAMAAFAGVKKVAAPADETDGRVLVRPVLPTTLNSSFGIKWLPKTYPQILFHCSARVMAPGFGRANEVFVFDRDANLVTRYDAIGGAYTDPWGYRDGATDTNGHVYFGWAGGVARHEWNGSDGTLIITASPPESVGTWRALAFDPTGDDGNGSLWSASWGSKLIEVDLAGSLLNAFDNLDGWSIYGMSFDDNDGNLWAHIQSGEVVKISTVDGRMMPGMGWDTGFANFSAQGGLSGFSELFGNLAAISQGTPDEMGIYDLTGTPGNPGNLIMGPVDLEGPTGSNGHLGVAVVRKPAIAGPIALP